LKPYGDLDRYWTGYLELEKQFSEFTSYVPFLEENRKVISPKLANLVSLSGNWIESIYKRRMLERRWRFPEVHIFAHNSTHSSSVKRYPVQALHRIPMLLRIWKLREAYVNGKA